jgi:hypothetical protein
MPPRLTQLLAALAGLAFAGLAASAQAAPAAGEPWAWVEQVQGGPQVRAATPQARCPVLTVDGAPAAMQVRAPADAAFPMTLCQLKLAPSVRSVALGTTPLPLLKSPPQRILIFGDTGCRVKDDLVQDCNNPRLWPFADVVRRAAAHHPDLVIHVGDYYYRETPCPAGNARCAGSPYGDNWATWRTEFFAPAQPLLATAPWVFVRGNHETCSRGGRGWYRLLDAGAQPLTCPATAAPFKVELGDLSLYVLDSGSAEDRAAPPDAVALFAGELNALRADMTHGKGWILTHRPIRGLAPVARLGPIGPIEIPLNKTEQAAVQGHDLSGVQMIVSGHIHHFATYSFGPRRPAQLISGAGGDIGEPADTPVVRQGQVDIDGLTADRISFDRFGYFLLDRAGADWLGTFRDIDDRVIASCRLHERQLACAPAKGVG